MLERPVGSQRVFGTETHVVHGTLLDVIFAILLFHLFPLLRHNRQGFSYTPLIFLKAPA